MVQIERSALVLCSAEQMFQLVNDVANYPKFVQGVISTEIFEQNDQFMRASMTLRRAGVETRFITRNELVLSKAISMNLESGPFKALKGDWTFEPVGDIGSKVSLDLRFEPENKLVGTLIAAMMSHIGGQLVDDFCKQAEKRYG